MIRAKWRYPCVEDEAGGCAFKTAKLTVEFGLLQDGRVAYVTVTKKADWEIYNSYAANAIHQASPFPPVPLHPYRPS